MSTNIEGDVIAFIADFVGVDPSSMSINTIINDDLGIDGEDGYELLVKFSELFNVDIDEIDETYFGSEGFDVSVIFYPIIFILRKIGLIRSVNKDIIPLPVSVLIESAKSGKWVLNPRLKDRA